LENVAGRLTIGDTRAPVRGYEIHMGRTHGPALARPLVALDSGSFDGAVSDDNQIAATYLHGVFDTPEACAALLAWAGVEGAEPLDYPALREASLDRLADSFAESLDLDVQRNIAMSLPSPVVTVASHTCVLRPRCTAVAFATILPSRAVETWLLFSSSVVKFCAFSGRCAMHA
jgi:hypothetical protein